MKLCFKGPPQGEVRERLKRPVLKTGVPVRAPWVRIPPSPQARYVPGTSLGAVITTSFASKKVASLGGTAFFVAFGIGLAGTFVIFFTAYVKMCREKAC